MLKYILILFFTFLFTACSNLNVIPIEETDKIELSKDLERFKYHLKKGEFSKIEPFLSDNLQKGYILKNLENSDFSNVNIFYSEPSFEDNIAYNVIALSSRDKTIYLEVEYKHLSNKWEITNIRQKGE